MRGASRSARRASPVPASPAARRVCSRGCAPCSSTRSRSSPARTSSSPSPASGRSARARIDDGYWGPSSETFEYWSHAACILPLEDWPAYGFQRRARVGAGPALAPPRGRREELLVCPRPAAGRGTAVGPRARRSEEGRSLVGLERDEDRRGVALGHRRARLPPAHGLPARLRPCRTRHPRRDSSEPSSPTRGAR